MTSDSDADTLSRRGLLKQAEGKLGEAESLLRDALLATERAFEPDDSALIDRLSALGQLLVARGAFEEAESHLTRALELCDREPYAQSDDVTILLDELSRLYLNRSAYAAAEPLLRRLLAIKQAHGDERPEVATVLASLAAVRHSLGDYVAADKLCRRALNIREKTLAPNHITTAATLESLAETCAARGRFGEAVALCKRALSIRELTLGASDVSVQMERERIADLQSRAAEEVRVTTPPRSAPAVQSSQPSIDWQAAERRPVKEGAQLPAVLIPWAAAEANTTSQPLDVGELEREAMADPSPSRSLKGIAGWVGLVAAAALLGLALQLGRKPHSTAYADAEPFKPVVHPETQVIPPATREIPESTHALDSVAMNASAGAQKAVALAAATPPALPTLSARELPPRVPVAKTPIAQPERRPRAGVPAPTPTQPDVGPANRVANPPARTAADSAPAAVASPVDNAVVPRGRSQSGNAPTSPTLIGAAPQPQYPDALRDQQVEGEVVVQFVVEETGRADISSMTVVRSPHALLTNAVRAVLPQLRFEPARTAPPQSTPRPETVRYAFTFHAPRK